MTDGYRFDQLTRLELRRRLPASTVVLPVGSTEQHGPHLPVSVDLRIVSDIADRAVAAAALQIPVLLLPALPYGCSHHHVPFGGTVSVSGRVYVDLIADLCRSLVDGGCRSVFVLNGHGGNESAIHGVLDRLAFEEGVDAAIATASYWSCAGPGLLQAAGDVGPVPGHAGGFETSCMLAICPELVDRERFPAYEAELQPLGRTGVTGVSVRVPGLWGDSDGRTDDSARATADKGHRALMTASEAVKDKIISFHELIFAPGAGR